MVAVGLGLVAAALVAGSAPADSTPVGALPKPTVTTVTTTKGSLVSIALPAARASTGLVWRIARPLDAHGVRQVAESNVGPAVVLVFRVTGRGRTSIVLAQTRGDTSPKAVRAVRYTINAR